MPSTNQIKVNSSEHKKNNGSNSNSINDNESHLLEDVLPSFEMHNYMLNRTIYDTENFRLLERPPNYDENVNTTNLNPIDPNHFVDPTVNPDAILLNNIGKFQKIDIPVKAQIVLTEKYPKLNIQNERENPLRQYKPGEILYGYIVIENKSLEPIPFEMLLVSMEGETTIPNPNPKSTTELQRSHFLKTYDLSACYHDGCIDLEAQGNLFCMQQDVYDKSHIGFSAERQIEPGIKHKKLFMFKIPHFLLDDTCSEQLPEHLEVPPSFGVDDEAVNGNASNIEIDPMLGYGRLDHYGSPIKTNDFALKSQSVSYSIKIQFIGRRLDYYKKFYSSDTSHEYDFIFLKNVQYCFRVDTSQSSEISEQPFSLNAYYPQLQTYDQLKLIEKLVTETLEDLAKKKILIEAGVTNSKDQDEIIRDEVVNDGTKKGSNFGNETIQPIFSSDTKCEQDLNAYITENNIQFTKDFFNKIEGNLNIKLKMDKDASMKSMKPRQLKSHDISIPRSSLEEKRQLSTNSLTGLTANVSSLNFNDNLRTVKSESFINTEKNQITGYIYIQLEFTPAGRINPNGKSALPNSITLTPNLRLINLQSPFPIPITIDGKFLINGELDTEKLTNTRKKYHFYLNQLIQSAQNIKSGIPRNLYNKVNSLSKLNASAHNVRKLFAAKTIDLHDQWQFDQELKNFKCDFKIPLSFDSKMLLRNSSLCIVPSFQRCNLCRLYMVDIEVSVKKAKKKIAVKFPIKVV